jgi:hypothetical protein
VGRLALCDNLDDPPTFQWVTNVIAGPARDLALSVSSRQADASAGNRGIEVLAGGSYGAAATIGPLQLRESGLASGFAVVLDGITGAIITGFGFPSSETLSILAVGHMPPPPGAEGTRGDILVTGAGVGCLSAGGVLHCPGTSGISQTRSSAVIIRVDGSSALAPLPPTDVKFESLSATSVVLTWRAPYLSHFVGDDDDSGGGGGGGGSDGNDDSRLNDVVLTYNIYMLSFLGRDGSSYPVVIGRIPAAGPQPYAWRHAELEAASWYRLAVTAVNEHGEGALSSPVDFVTCLNGELFAVGAGCVPCVQGQFIDVHGSCAQCTGSPRTMSLNATDPLGACACSDDYTGDLCVLCVPGRSFLLLSRCLPCSNGIAYFLLIPTILGVLLGIVLLARTSTPSSTFWLSNLRWRMRRGSVTRPVTARGEASIPLLSTRDPAKSAPAQ